MSKVKPKPKVRKGIFKAKGGKVCPVDATELVFNPEIITWKCQYPGCKYIEYPETGTGNPVHAKGENKLVITKDDTGDMAFFIMSENSVFVSVPKDHIQFNTEGLPVVTVPITEVVKI